MTPGGSAEKTKRFEPGDIITDINAETVDHLSADLVVSLLRGDPNTSVVLAIERPQSDAAWEDAARQGNDAERRGGLEHIGDLKRGEIGTEPDPESAASASINAWTKVGENWQRKAPRAVS